MIGSPSGKATEAAEAVLTWLAGQAAAASARSAIADQGLETLAGAILPASTASVSVSQSDPLPARVETRPSSRQDGEAVLALPNPDWLHHRLTITGPAEAIAAFRTAAAGAGTIPWHLDLDRLQEDWFHLLVAPQEAATASGTAERRISVAGARVLSQQLRDAVGRRHELAIARVGRSYLCPFDLHALLPVPEPVLWLGPDDPGALAWLWRHWGTTRPLRQVQDVCGQAAGCAEFTFWSADWTPWRALATLAETWSVLRFAARPTYGLS